MVSDDNRNIQIFYYAPKMSQSWKGQKLLSRAEFHVGAHVTKFLRLQSLQRKLVDAVSHVAGLNPKAFRQFRSNGKAHRPGLDSIVDCELLCHYAMLPLEEQLEIAHQVGTTRSQILSNLSDLSLGTSFL